MPVSIFRGYSIPSAPSPSAAGVAVGVQRATKDIVGALTEMFFSVVTACRVWTDTARARPVDKGEIGLWMVC
jgi:hypothetical protein